MAGTRREKLAEMLKQSPDDTFLIYGLALEHIKDEEFDEGIRQLADLTVRDPNYHAAFFQLGQTCYRIGEVEQARDWLTRGVGVAKRLGNDHAAGEMAGLLQSLE